MLQSAHPINRLQPMAGQSLYSPELGNIICDAVANGISLRELERNGTLPVTHAMVAQWAHIYPDFATQYARAREHSADSYDDRIGDIADMVLDGRIEPNAARVAIDALKWSAGKRKPKVYGDVQRIEMDGNISITNALQLAMTRAERVIDYADVADAPVVSRRELEAARDQGGEAPCDGEL